MEADEFHKQVKNVLEHLYDTAYLETHPLSLQVTGTMVTSQATRAQKLRSLIKENIEALRPPRGTPSSSPEWRSYLALRYRYVQGMSMGQIEGELGIGLRQVQRELRKGLEALSTLLWRMHTDETDQVSSPVLSEHGHAQALQNELNQWKLNRQACQVRELIDNTLGMLKPLLDDTETVLQVDLPASLPPVFVDSILMRQALSQLLRLMVKVAGKNALQLQANSQGNQVNLILQSQIVALGQLEEAWQIAQLLIDRQGGTLAVETRPEIGTQVVLSLPQASPIRVLVIDDNQAIHRLTERYLTPHHYDVIHATNGREALQLAAETHPDVITLDVMMPGMDGWEILRSLTQNSTTRGIPVVVCSVLKDQELAFSLGARAYLKKPVDRLELLATLAQLYRPPASPAGAAPPPGPEDNLASR